ncbi:tryptophan synthase beta subunit-like PLP-dependent enzyme [Podospora australis]|uniref:Tryptophan synthase beta subunit-like PLP-dependent enzyme n=1 Tax=Podospora australis TaxID=1536484 RepID=A0AAN7AHM1_9PEZI|nr:tryptophan synthase beta subunit-like PLP-dependent enzyme [Podospora australis]
MARANNPLNVFKGPDALHRYFQPDENPPLPLVELPDALNPLREDGVRIFAKLLTALPAQNVKSLPGISGSTVLSLGMISRALWGHDDVYAYVTNKKPVESLRLLRFFGLKVSLYGGLAQQEPSDPKGIMSRLRRMANDDPEKVCYLGQYDNDGNWRSHEKWTGRQIWEQLPEVNVLCSTIGTGGCITGTGKYLKEKKPSVKVVGVCNVFGDPTPGPRHFPGFESSPFPWREVIDSFEQVKSADSFRMSMRLSRHGIIAGPSSGEALHGLLAHLTVAKEEGRLQEMADPDTGEINCVFLCADLPYQYMDMYYTKLGEEEFPPIYNEGLLDVDQNPYDERWFLSPSDVAELLYQECSEDFFESHEPLCMVPSSCACDAGRVRFSPPPKSEEPGLFPEPFSSSESLPTSSASDSTMFSVPSPPSSIFSAATTASEGITESNLRIIDIRPRADYLSSHLRNTRSVPLTITKEDFFGDAEAVRERWLEMRDAFEGLDDGWDEKGKVLVICLDGDSGAMATSMLRARGREAFCVTGGFGKLEEFLGGRGRWELDVD